MTLVDMTDSALALLERYVLASIEEGRDRMEAAVAKGNLPMACQAQGAVEELRHMAAMCKTILRSREKGS